MKMRLLSRPPLAGASRRGRLAQGGFTLLELMIVVALIAIIAAYAIPVVLQARIAANEASAVSTLRTVTSVNSQYRTRFGSFASTLTNLFDAGLLDPAVANPFKAGYTFSYTGITSTTYSMTANPTNPDESGNRYFFVDTTGVIRFSYTGPANASDTPL